MNTAVIVAFLFCLVAAYASALPAEPINNDNVKEVAPVAGIEDQEVLQGAEARWHGGGGGYQGGGYQGGGGYHNNGCGYHGCHGKRKHWRH